MMEGLLMSFLLLALAFNLSLASPEETKDLSLPDLEIPADKVMYAVYLDPYTFFEYSGNKPPFLEHSKQKEVEERTYKALKTLQNMERVFSVGVFGDNGDDYAEHDERDTKFTDKFSHEGYGPTLLKWVRELISPFRFYSHEVSPTNIISKWTGGIKDVGAATKLSQLRLNRYLDHHKKSYRNLNKDEVKDIKLIGVLFEVDTTSPQNAGASSRLTCANNEALVIGVVDNYFSHSSPDWTLHDAVLKFKTAVDDIHKKPSADADVTPIVQELRGRFNQYKCPPLSHVQNVVMLPVRYVRDNDQMLKDEERLTTDLGWVYQYFGGIMDKFKKIGVHFVPVLVVENSEGFEKRNRRQFQIEELPSENSWPTEIPVIEEGFYTQETGPWLALSLGIPSTAKVIMVATQRIPLAPKGFESDVGWRHYHENGKPFPNFVIAELKADTGNLEASVDAGRQLVDFFEKITADEPQRNNEELTLIIDRRITPIEMEMAMEVESGIKNRFISMSDWKLAYGPASEVGKLLKQFIPLKEVKYVTAAGIDRFFFDKGMFDRMLERPTKKAEKHEVEGTSEAKRRGRRAAKKSRHAKRSSRRVKRQTKRSHRSRRQTRRTHH